MKTIELLDYKLGPQDEKLDDFNNILLQLVGYAVDKETGMKRDTKSIDSIITRMISNIDRDFFNILYQERDEKKEIKDLINSRALIFIAGYWGVGKTVVLRKIDQELDDPKKHKLFHYINITELPFSKVDANFDREVYQFLNSSIIEKFFIHRDQKEKIQYETYKYFVPIHKQLILEGSYSLQIKNFDDWNEYKITRPGFSRDLSKLISKIPELHKKTLISIIKLLTNEKNSEFIVCFDNCDKFNINLLKRFIRISIEINGLCTIPVVIATRIYDFRKIVNEVYQEEGRNDAYSHLLLYDIIQTPLIRERLKYCLIKIIDPILFQNIIGKRLNYLWNNSELKDVRDFLGDCLAQSHFANDIKGQDIKSYRENFYRIYTKINMEFFPSEITALANENIREIQRCYISFINNILVGPESSYLQELLFYISRSPFSITPKWHNLRNHLRRWILIPESDNIRNGEMIYPNIHENSGTVLNHFPLRILEFIANYSKKYSQRVSYEEIYKFFIDFEVDIRTLNNALSKLSQINGTRERALIWIDGIVYYDDMTIEKVSDNAYIDILPAGNFFLSKLSVSKEYTFWSILTIPLDIPLLDHIFTLKDTYREDFQYKLVLHYFKNYYPDIFSVEMDRIFKLNLQSKYQEYLLLDNDLFPVRAIESIRYSLEKAYVRPERKKNIENELNTLMCSFNWAQYK